MPYKKKYRSRVRRVNRKYRKATRNARKRRTGLTKAGRKTVQKIVKKALNKEIEWNYTKGTTDFELSVSGNAADDDWSDGNVAMNKYGALQ